MVKSHEATEDPTEINALAILGADPDVRDIAALESMRTMATFAVQARRMTVKQRAKRLRKLQSGEVVTLGEIIDSQQKRAGFELDTEPCDTDLWKPCAGCQQPIERGRAKRCDECEHPPCRTGCGKRAPPGCMAPSAVARRHGAPYCCPKCFNASRTPEQKERGRAGVRKSNTSRTPKQRTEAARKRVAARWAKRAPQ